MHGWGLVLYGAAGLVMSTFAGVAGAGGGFVMTPLGIVLGLSPAQAIATGKFNGLAVTIGSLTGLRAHKANVNKKRIAVVMVLALVVGLLVPYVIRALDSRTYRLSLGIMLLLLVPVMIYKKVGTQQRTPTTLQKGIGGVLLMGSMFLQGAFSGGLGVLVNIVLMSFLGQTANEAHITKRWSQAILNIVIILSVIGNHLIVWHVVAVGASTTLVGSYIGGRIAVKKGDAFAVSVMISLMVISSLVLIIGAF